MNIKEISIFNIVSNHPYYITDIELLETIDYLQGMLNDREYECMKN
tara:strand:- start:850 stop:987 length:138 start_codon:yes stop_codon:yes gene_type:complete